ncbi:Gldg family protein [Microbulbifer thermotolerans]|uniref:Gldg family protein n=1 Tax=Microbulbifer thermotolerans TaxID=252514 RepID=UPI0022489499|nr:Gldg family protein [Microbulbifer thermotolerans]MCX2829961.1 Gldg family protein [Microbulbifer thermotolerans]
MQPEATVQSGNRKSGGALIRRVAGKEITLFFASPVAYLFLACFAAVSLFVFFWGESFFARNISDVRPLFEWMPLLLIFLCSTLTMRLWSEERRSGTLEHVLTMPVPLWHFVAGKFLACLALLGIALAITLPLPVTVAIIGDLDWGPVVAGYLATFLLGAAYLSIGLFVSAQASNQIVSLIVSCALCGVFYLLGAPVLTDLFGSGAADWLRALGTGSRFDAITRGVIDLRDLYYYLSLVAVFLALNTLVLERERWAAGGDAANRNRWRAITALLVANALGANLWLGQIHSLRLDVTEGRLYSISPATRSYLAQLEEPLLIRGYFSAKTHPLLAPLVPQLRDLLREYQVAGDGRVRVEFVDPAKEPELEQEANQKYGIEPVPFQVADRYQASIVSSYFDVLVQYGDEHEVLGFRDLIEIKAGSETDVDVRLRNPEHDLTRAIKKVMQSYQAGGNLFDTVKGELQFTAYVSADERLPQQLQDFKQAVNEVVGDLQQQAGGRLSVAFIEPEENGGAVAQRIATDYGFQPMAAGLFGKPFYFYLTLAKGDQVVQIPLDDLKKDSLERNLEAGIKRFASGFTKTVALVAPEPDFSHGFSGGQRFSQLETLLGAELNIEREDLSDGRVSGEADILLLLSPRNLDQKQLYAVDQFLMQGGTVIAATSPYSAELSNRNLTLATVNSGLEDWLKHMGLEVEHKLVLDPQNSAFPVPVTRNIGGFQLQELRMLDYPYFIDARGDGLNSDNPITANLPQVTMSWASPIRVDGEKSAGRKITELLKSSDGAWLSTSTNVMPRLVNGAVSPFTPEGETGTQLLGVISAGRFDSYFAGKQPPMLAEKLAEKEEAQEGDSEGESVAELESLPTQINRSPESARIILFSSNDFLRDQVVRMTSSAVGSEYLNSLQMIANSVDWALEDAGLLSIRSRGHFNRTLPPMEHGTQMFWEYLNYICALLALGLVALIQQLRKRARQNKYRELLGAE